MNTGIRGTVTAMMTADSQSSVHTATMTATGTINREHELREVAREVPVERIDAVRRERREVPIRCRAGVGSIGCELLYQRDPQLGLHVARRAVGRHLGVPSDRGTSEDDEQQHEEWCAYVADAHVTTERASDHIREEPRLCDDESCGDRAEDHCDAEVKACRSPELHEPRIDRAAPTPTGGARHGLRIGRGMGHGSPLPRSAHTAQPGPATSPVASPTSDDATSGIVALSGQSPGIS